MGRKIKTNHPEKGQFKFGFLQAWKMKAVITIWIGV